MNWGRIWGWYWCWDFLIYVITCFVVVEMLVRAGYPWWLSALAALAVDFTRRIAWHVFKLWRAQR